jgi:hypothetical protein
MSEEVKPVGAGDIGVVYEHLVHLIADVRGGDYPHALTHLWPILLEIRAAIEGRPTYGASAMTDVARESALKCCDELEALVRERTALRAAGGEGGRVDWKYLLTVLLRLLPYLL